MYRCSVDQAITYTSDDFILFRESPFACWMERLTLENPGHGIPADVNSCAPSGGVKPEDDLASTLMEEGKDVVSIDWQTDEALRRTATLAAMRHGVDFIVNGQLAVGPLSESANLLMRTSGYSELGNYLYIPCDTQHKTTLASAFRLSFLADLLHSLQGQLPPQMLILRGSSGVIPLQTEEHIYHYQAVKQRFMSAQSAFKSHRMPDPVESAHFGRWSDCANELLKQRALGEPEMPVPVPVVEELRAAPSPAPAIAQSPPVFFQAKVAAYDMNSHASQALNSWPAIRGEGTLAEQARMLSDEPRAQSGLSVVAVNSTLENLEFIGSSPVSSSIGSLASEPEPEPEPVLETETEPEPVSLPQEQVHLQECKPEGEPQEYPEPPPPSLRNPARVDLDRVADAPSSPDKAAAASFNSSLITHREQ